MLTMWMRLAWASACSATRNVPGKLIHDLIDQCCDLWCDLAFTLQYQSGLDNYDSQNTCECVDICVQHRATLISYRRVPTICNRWCFCRMCVSVDAILQDVFLQIQTDHHDCREVEIVQTMLDQQWLYVADACRNRLPTPRCYRE